MAVATVMVLAPAAPASAVQIGTPGPYVVTVQPAVQYAAPAIDTLIECRPTATGTHFAGPFPAIMLIHGGYWRSGDNGVSPTGGYSGRWCTLWASWGYDAFSVGYRLTGQAPWPAQIVDVQAAIRWVRANAAMLNVNRTMIVAEGDSAGGQLAMVAGFSYANIPGDLATDNPTINPQPQLVISEFGPWTWGPPQPTGAPSVLAEDYAAQILVDHADGRTTATTPKTMFVQGTGDTLVNQCTESEAAYRFLTGNNRPASYVAYNGGHEFINMDPATYNQVVGAIQVQTISFAYARAHLAGILPLSEPGPGTAFADAQLPVGCPISQPH